MPVYQYKGVHYTMDTTDAAVAKQRILRHLGETPDAESSKKVAAGDLLEGAINTGITAVASIPGAIAGAGRTVHDAATGFLQRLEGSTPTYDNAVEAGIQAMEQTTSALGDRFKAKGEGARRGEQFIGEKFMEAVEGAGNLAVNYGIAKPFMKAAELMGANTDKAEALVRGGAETAVQFLPFERGVTLAGRAANRVLPHPIGERGKVPAVPPTAEFDPVILSKATELAQKRDPKAVPTQQDYLTAARLLQGETDPGTVPYTPHEAVTAPISENVPKNIPGSEIPGIDMPPKMGLESAGEADLRSALGPVETSLRNRVESTIEAPTGDVNHLDPVALQAAREAPEAGALPEGTAPYQAALDFSKPAELGMPESRLNPRTEDGLYSLPTSPEFHPGPADVIVHQPDLPLRTPSRAADMDPFNKNYGLAGKTTATAQLDHIASLSESEFNRLISQHLRDTNPLYEPVTSLQDRITPKEAGLPENTVGIIRGLADSLRGIIYSKEGQGHLSENTVIHENVHGVLARLVDRWEAGDNVPSRYKPMLENLSNLLNFSREALNANGDKYYGLTNLNEFIAEVMSNPDFRQKLAGIRLDPSNKIVQKHKLALIAQNVLDAVTVAMLRVLGLPVTKDNMSALMHTLDQSNKLIKEVGADPNSFSRYYTKQALNWNEQRTGSPRTVAAQVSKAPERSPKSLADYKEDLKSQGLNEDSIKRFGPALYAKYKEEWLADNAPRKNPVGYDNRTHEEFKQDLFRKDGSQRIDDVGVQSGPAYRQANQHPVVRRVYDQLSQASVAIDQLFAKFYRNANLEDVGFNPLKGKIDPTNLRRVVRTESPDSIAALKHKLTDADKEAIMDLPGKSINYDDPVSLKAVGLSGQAIKYVQALRTATKAAWEAANKARSARGLATIPYRDDFLWSQVRQGAYQVFGIKDGKHTYLAGFDNFADAQKVAKDLQKQGKDVYAAPAKDNPLTVQIPDDNFLSAERLLPDAESKALFHQAVKEAIKRAGVNKYALRRDSSAAGYAGSKEIVNTLGAKKAFEGVDQSIQSYLRKMASYAGSAEHMKRISEVMTDREIKDAYPNAVAHANYMYEQFRGEPRALDAVLEQASNWLGTLPVLKNFADAHTGQRFLTGTANWFVNNQLVWLNPVFYLASAIQHFMMPSRLMQINGEQFAGKGSMSHAMLAGQLHLFMPTERSKAILGEAMKNGSIEPRFVEALDWVQAESKVLNAIKLGLGQKLAGWADSFGRASAYTISFEFAKSLNMSDEKAHSFAARESQGVMVQYDRWARMPVFNKLGVIGDIGAPLTHFISNYAYNLGSYMHDAVVGNKHVDKRLIGAGLTLLATQLAISGIKGMPGYQDLENLWLLLNKTWIEDLGGEPVPMPSELMANLPESVQSGAISAGLGVNATGTLGAGTIIGSIGQTAAVDYAGKYIKGMLVAANPSSTDDEKRLAAQNLPPPMLRQVLQNALQHKGPTEPADVYDASGKLVYRRNNAEQIAALATGRQTIGEAKAKQAERETTEINSAKSAQVASAKKQLIESLAKGREITWFTNRVLKNNPDFVEYLGKGTLDKDLETYLLDRNIPFETRERIKAAAQGKVNRVLEASHANLKAYRANQR